MQRIARAVLFSTSLLSAAGCAVVEPAPGPESLTKQDGSNVATGPTVDEGLPDGEPADPVGVDLGGADAAGTFPSLTVCDLRKLKINEVQTAGPNGATDEFVELFNPCSGAVSLSGGKIVYRAATSGGDTFTFATFAGETIPARGYFVVANGNFTGTSNIKPFEGGGGMAVAAGGVALKDATDVVVDSMGWGTATNAFVEGSPCGAPTSGQSAARSSDGFDYDVNATDWKLSTPTPGAAN